MSLPRGRVIVVDKKPYEWLVKPLSKDRYGLKWTAPSLSLTIKPEGEKVVQYLCRSKHWTDAHEECYFDDPSLHAVEPHKVAFGPTEVKEVIQGNMELEDWTVALSAKQRKSKS